MTNDLDTPADRERDFWARYERYERHRAAVYASWEPSRPRALQQALAQALRDTCSHTEGLWPELGAASYYRPSGSIRRWLLERRLVAWPEGWSQAAVAANDHAMEPTEKKDPPSQPDTKPEKAPIDVPPNPGAEPKSDPIIDPPQPG
jgi:hypothetical protein